MPGARDPLQRFFVPEPDLDAPRGFERLREPLRLGLPHRITLTRDVDLILVAPVGVAAPWRIADPLASVTRSSGQAAGWKPAAGDVTAAPPARILVAHSGKVLAQLPLTAGLRRRLPAPMSPTAAEIELAVLAWDIHAGTLRGPGEFGSWLELAWRPARGPVAVHGSIDEAREEAAA